MNQRISNLAASVTRRRKKTAVPAYESSLHGATIDALYGEVSGSTVDQKLGILLTIFFIYRKNTIWQGLKFRQYPAQAVG